MVKEKDDIYYVGKILKDINYLIDKVHNLSLEEFSNNEMLCDSVLFRLIQISENANKITENFKIKHSQIPWKSIKGFRNRIVHKYGEVVMDIVYDTVKNDMIELKLIFDEYLKISV